MVVLGVILAFALLAGIGALCVIGWRGRMRPTEPAPRGPSAGSVPIIPCPGCGGVYFCACPQPTTKAD